MIISNIEYENEGIYVTGNTNIGVIKGKWCHDEKPVQGETYFFELNIDDFDRNLISIIYDESFTPSVNYRNNCVEFKGICEAIDDIYIVRFAIDWIEMIAIKNDDFTIRKGMCISSWRSETPMW